MWQKIEIPIKKIQGKFTFVKINEKIRIGYVLKSADVGTLFSRKNSENSSHTYAHTRAYPRTPVHTHAYPHTPAHTCAHLHTPAHTQHIPTDALNLINHMKLHVNGKMAERNKERKKNEGTRVR